MFGKKFLVSLFLIACPFILDAQFLAFGYRSHFGGMGAYKNVVNFYNANRSWLDKEMNPSAHMVGFEVGFGGSRPKYGYTLGRFYAQFNKTTARGTNNNIAYKRSIKTKILGIEIIDAWYTPLHYKGFNFGLGLMPAGLGFMRVHTELNGEKKQIPLTDFYTDFLSSSHMYLNFHVDITKLTEKEHSWHLQVFNTLGPTKEYELLYLNREINPNSFDQIRQRTVMKINNRGMKLIFSY
ncbi:MAG: hypothetical protein N4A41_13310 [Crocinitomicaceae bacterium]|jgi:hypothetical protein|nr:hypothetical protein [Crocinitomicaceae bacterium]